MADAKDKWLAITGCTGHIGFAVLVKALEAGYRVRAIVRDQSRSQDILRSKALANFDAVESRLAFFTVPDVVVAGAYNEALKDVVQIIHVASPLARAQNSDFQRDIIDPAVIGTIGLLNSAASVQSIKRIVITSSLSANVDTFDPENNPRPVTPDYRRADYPQEFITDIERAYHVSKTAALNATDKFVKEKKPHYDVINIMPSYVFGPKGLATSPRMALESSNIYGLGLVMRHSSWKDTLISASSCHVDDVAEAHIRALDHDIEGNQDFALASPFNPLEVSSIVRARFPAAVTAGDGGVFNATGCYRWHHIPYDAHKTEDLLLRRKFKGIEEQIVDSAEQVLELLGQKQ